MGVGGHCLHRDVLAEVLCQGPKEIYQMVPQGYPPGTCCTLRGSLHSHAPTCLPREAGRGSGSQWEPLLLWGHCSPKGAVGMPWSCYPSSPGSLPLLSHVRLTPLWGLGWPLLESWPLPYRTAPACTAAPSSPWPPRPTTAQDRGAQSRHQMHVQVCL